MRRCSLVASALLAAAGFLASVGGADADVWCRRDFGRQTAVCAFASYQACASAARVSGGRCERGRQAPRNAFRASAGHASAGYAYSSTPLPVNLRPSRFTCN